MSDAGCRADDDTEDDEGGSGDAAGARFDCDRVQKTKGTGYGRRARVIGKAEHMVLRLSARVKKQLRRRNSKRASFSSPKTAAASNADSSGKLVSASGDGDDDDGQVVNRGCFFCFTRPQNSETTDIWSCDPNSPNFSRQMIKNLIERNNFYSK